MTRIVLDTNVLVSGMINAFGAPGRIVDLLREGYLQLVVDDRILAEYAAVLNRAKFRPYFTAKDARDILLFLEYNSHYTVATVHLAGLPDPNDRSFLEVALSAAVPLVTGNVAHFPPDRCSGCEVLVPAVFLRSFRAPDKDGAD
jgi:putative PIN family toxin of toxin-antitoxin system